MQTSDERRYWAQKREAQRSANAQLPKPRRETVLLATSQEEYTKLCREYPNMKVRLDMSGVTQGQLFDTTGLRDV